jgi:hypothetical protein
MGYFTSGSPQVSEFQGLTPPGYSLPPLSGLMADQPVVLRFDLAAMSGVAT